MNRSSIKGIFLNGGYPIGLALCGVLLTYAMPEWWSESKGPLSWLVAWMTTVVPSIQHFTSVSSFPGTTATVLAIMWALSPILVVAHLWSLDVLHGSERRRVRPVLPEKRHGIAYACVLVIAGLVMFFLIVVVPFVGGPISQHAFNGHDRGAALVRAVSQSRLWLGVYAALSCWICSFGVAISWIVLIGSIRKLQSGTH
jgi:hypothetical protein